MILTNLRWRLIQLAINGRDKCPTTKGNINCIRIEPIALSVSIAWLPSASINSPTKIGDRKTPKILEAEALQIAAAIFPPATEVNAMADWTVAGNAHK